MLEAVKIDFWQRAARGSRLERVTNERIREIIQVTHKIVDEIKNRRLMWYRHVQKMPET